MQKATQNASQTVTQTASQTAMQTWQQWQQWKQKHALKIQHIAGFEERFVDTVLSHISLISPDDVVPQYHFVDHKKGNRYIDFVIAIPQGAKKILLPIELDGKSKFDSYVSFNDTLERQNDLIKQFGALLRYSNKKMLESPEEIIAEISQFIRHTQAQKDTLAIIQRNFEQYEQSIDAKLTAISQKLEALASENREQNIEAQIEQKWAEQQQLLGLKHLAEYQQKVDEHFEALNQKIHHIQHLNTQMNNTQMNNARANTSILWLLGGFCLLLLGGLFWFNRDHNPEPEVAVVVNEKATSPSMSAIQALPEERRPPQAVENVPRFTNTVDKPAISTDAVRDYLDQTQKVCGVVVEVKPFSQGVYLNFDRAYPQQSLSAVIWNADLAKFDTRGLKKSENQRRCVSGKITLYKGSAQIVVNEPEQFEMLGE